MSKIPPQAPDIEEAILGAIMLEKRAIVEVMNILSSEMFYSEHNSKIFRVCQEMFSKGNPIDIFTVTNALRKTRELESVGGAYYITQLTNRIASAANVKSHSYIILEKYLSRKTIEILTEGIEIAFSESVSPLEYISVLGGQLLKLTSSNKGAEVTLQQAVKKVIKEMEEAASKPESDKVIGIKTGFRELDEATGGWQRAQLIILAARPGMGKTSMAIAHAIAAAKEGKKVHFQSYEMSDTGVTRTVLSQETQLERNDFKTGKAIGHERLVDILGQIEDYYITIDTDYLPISRLRAKCISKKIKEGLDMLIVDYLQLIPSDGKYENDTARIGAVSRGLKKLANELDIPIIALSQLNRELEKRADKRPVISDLRSSGDIEQDADTVLFLFRPSHYGIEYYDSGEPVEYRDADYIISKQREGALGEIRVYWEGSQTRYYDPHSEPIDPVKERNFFN